MCVVCVCVYVTHTSLQPAAHITDQAPPKPISHTHTHASPYIECHTVCSRKQRLNRRTSDKNQVKKKWEIEQKWPLDERSPSDIAILCSSKAAEAQGGRGAGQGRFPGNVVRPRDRNTASSHACNDVMA